MKNILRNRWLVFGLRLILCAIFITAAIVKIQDIDTFVATVRGYDILPDALADIYGYAAPWVELFIGCAFFLGLFTGLSSILSILLSLSFIVAGSYALMNSAGGNCGCFGTLFTFSHPVSLTIDVFMIIASVLLLYNRDNESIGLNILIRRFDFRRPVFDYLSRFAVVALVTVIIGLVSFGTGVKTIEIAETVSISAPLTNVVDSSLLLKKHVLLEFYAEDCHACEEAEPIINDIELEYESELTVIRIDYNENPQYVSDMNIKRTPTAILIVGENSDGTYNVLCRFENSIVRENLEACIDSAIRSR